MPTNDSTELDVPNRIGVWQRSGRESVAHVVVTKLGTLVARFTMGNTWLVGSFPESLRGGWSLLPNADCGFALECIKMDRRYLENVGWGEVRPGHPEGTVALHVAELESLLELLPVTAQEKGKLLLLIHVHDTFKARAARRVPIDDPQSHASLAAAFLSEFIAAPDLVAITQNHDVPFSMYRSFIRDGKIRSSRLARLKAEIPNFDLFCVFIQLDGATGGKDTAATDWFFKFAGVKPLVWLTR